MVLRHILRFAGLLLLSSPPTLAEEDNIAKFGVYVIVADLDASRAFYEKLFGKTPYVRNDRLVGFEVAGSLYALFTQKALDRATTKGDNTVPYIRVNDIDKEFARAARSGARLIDAKIVDEGAIRLFRIADPDGNIIEFFSIAAPRPG